MKTSTKKAILSIITITTLLSACATSDIGASPQTSPKETFPGQISHGSDQTAEKSNISEDASKEVGLSLYVTPEDVYIHRAIPIFRRLYPDIELEILEPENKEMGSTLDHPYYQEKDAMFVSIMAGKGPDILPSTMFGYFIKGDDIVYTLNERLIENGVFADMSEFYDNDETLPEDLHKVVMDAGVYDGKRYLFPLDYYIPLLLSSERVLNENNFNVENNSNYLSFLEETKTATTNGLSVFNSSATYSHILSYFGKHPLDLDKNIIDVNFPEFEATFDWITSISNNIKIDDPHQSAMLDYNTDIFKLRDNETLFLSNSRGGIYYNMYVRFSELMISIGETPVLVPLRNSNGGITAQVNYSVAVSANCKNLDNAYKFIQVLLSPEVQDNINLRSSYYSGISVLSSSMDSVAEFLENSIFGFVAGFPPENERPKFNQELHENYMSFTDEIDMTIWNNWTLQLRPFVDEYLDGKISYEDCIKNFERKIGLWLSE